MDFGNFGGLGFSIIPFTSMANEQNVLMSWGVLGCNWGVGVITGVGVDGSWGVTQISGVDGSCMGGVPLGFGAGNGYQGYLKLLQGHLDQSLLLLVHPLCFHWGLE